MGGYDLVKETVKPEVLLVTGCSHSAGFEILGEQGYPKSKIYKKDIVYEERYRSFGGHLSRKNNLIHINVCHPGLDNITIMRNTVRKINQLLTQYDSSKIISLIGWTGYPRLAIPYNGNLKMLSAHIDLMPNWTKLQDKKIVKFWKLWRDLIALQPYDVQVYNQLFQYQLLRSFLRDKNISYYMFNAVECLKPFHKIKDFLELPAPDEYNQEDRSYDLEGIKILANDVRFRHPFKTEEIYYQHLVGKGHDPKKGGRWHHFEEPAHIMWSEVLDKEMTELSLLPKEKQYEVPKELTLPIKDQHIDENIIQKSGHSNEKDPRDWRQPYRK